MDYAGVSAGKDDVKTSEKSPKIEGLVCEESLRLLELDIQRMPGFERRGFSYQGLRQGIHVIWGPNGSGKTTTCKALRALLWPHEQKGLSPVLLNSSWEWGGKKIEVSREASKVTMPSFLAERLIGAPAQAYTLVLDDLFHQQERNFTRLIVEEVRGGYHFEDLREKYFIPPKLGYQEIRQISKLGRDLEQIARDQILLVEQEEKMVQLKEDIEQAQRAQEDLGQTSYAIEGVNLQRDIETIQQQLRAFPPGLQEVREEDEKELEKLLIKQLPLDFDEMDIEGAKRALHEALTLCAEIQGIDIQLQGRKEDIEADKEVLFEHARMLNVAPEELFRISTVELQPLKKELSEEALKQGRAYLEEWLGIENSHPWVLFLALGVGSIILFALLFHEQKPVPTVLSAIMALFTGIVPVRGILEKQQVAERYKGLNLSLPTRWEKQEIVHKLRDLEELIEQGTGRHLWLDEIRRARDTILSLKKQEAFYEALIKKREAILANFFMLIPTAYHRLQPAKALQAFQEMIELQECSLRKKSILSRTQCYGSDPLGELREKKRLLKRYKELEEERLHLEGRLEQIVLKLKSTELLELPTETLQNRQQALETKVASLKELQSEETRVHHAVKQELVQSRFTEKSSELYQAKQEFQSKQQLWQEHLLAQFLLKELEEQYEKKQRPEVIQIASRYFEKFTLGSYSIDAVIRQDQGHQFRVYDHKQEQQISIEALSQGTALQLLLSIRLGYLAAHEQSGIKLPLLLDELLSHVDDDRFQCIAEALLEIAKERQIFLFTCQRATWQAWEKIYEATSSPYLHFIDLEQLQGKEQRMRAPIIRSENTLEIRKPSEHETLIEYAVDLGLSGLDMTLRVAEQPVWIVLHTAQQLFQALIGGRKKIGQLKEVLLYQPSMFFEHEIIQKKIDLLERFFLLKKVGNPPLVWRESLEEAVKLEIFGESFLDAVDLCAKSAERKACMLLDKLRMKGVKRFPKNSIGQLEEFLLQQGYLDQRSPLSEEEIRHELWKQGSLTDPGMISYVDNLSNTKRNK